jgi:hypothetical protein
MAVQPVSEQAESAFLTRLGLDANPFLHWDADQEDRLPEYFVPPPYFPTVFGDPRSPASTIAFAPRGGGKSAQRRMVELSADPAEVLIVSHLYFPFLSHRRPTEVTLDDHLIQIIRHTLVGILGRFGLGIGNPTALSPERRTSLQLLVSLYLDELTRVELEESLNALKNTGEKIRQFYNKLAWGYNTLGRSTLASLGVPAPELPNLQDLGREAAPHPFEDLRALGAIISESGLRAVYVLVDRVDEAASTSSDWGQAYALIAPLVEDLRVLGLRPFCFKFFIPDGLQREYAGSGRPDRVAQFHLDWRGAEINEMLSKRLQAYSSGRITEPSQIFSDNEAVQWFVSEWLVRLAERSPRDMVRLLNRILSEQLRLNPAAERIDAFGMLHGLDAFCEERARELVSANVLAELRRLGRVDFTVGELGSEVFKISTNAARQKIQEWERLGIVHRIQDTESTGRRPRWRL